MQHPTPAEIEAVRRDEALVIATARAEAQLRGLGGILLEELIAYAKRKDVAARAPRAGGGAGGDEPTIHMVAECGQCGSGKLIPGPNPEGPGTGWTCEECGCVTLEDGAVIEEDEPEPSAPGPGDAPFLASRRAWARKEYLATLRPAARRVFERVEQKLAELDSVTPSDSSSPRKRVDSNSGGTPTGVEVSGAGGSSSALNGGTQTPPVQRGYSSAVGDTPAHNLGDGDVGDTLRVIAYALEKVSLRMVVKGRAAELCQTAEGLRWAAGDEDAARAGKGGAA